jgi:hypothetical protein
VIRSLGDFKPPLGSASVIQKYGDTAGTADSLAFGLAFGVNSDSRPATSCRSGCIVLAEGDDSWVAESGKL